MNGAVSFLNGCQNGVAMINSGKFNTALILAAEIENNLEEDGRALLGLKETGSAAILDATPEGEENGFLAFYHRYFTEYVDKFYSRIGQESGQAYLDFRRDPKLNEYYLDCIPMAVDDFLKREELTQDDIKVVIPPQVSGEFVERLKSKLGKFDPESIVAVADCYDYYTSSTVYGMQAAWDRQMAEKGDLGLIVNVGTGIQVVCALYRF